MGNNATSLLNERVTLNSTCCLRGKKETFDSMESDISDEKTRRGVRRVWFNTMTVRNAPYTSNLDIERGIPKSTLSDHDTEICLGINFEPDCKPSDPEPLKSWTRHEQQILIDSLKEHPQARENESYRRKLMKKVRHELPHKSLVEIKECYAYLLDVRLSHVRYDRFVAIRPASPSQGRKPVKFQT